MDGHDPTRAALLLLDFQNYGLHADGYWAKQGLPDFPASAYPAVANAAQALAAARHAGLLVVHGAAAWRPGSPEMNMSIPAFARGPDRAVEGTWAAAFYEPVRPEPGELVIIKRSVSALAGTELDRLLRVRDVNTLVLAGIATNFAVEGTVREAVDHGYRAVVLADCCASVTAEMHDFAIRVILPELCTVSTVEAFARWLGE